jgi:hypothetical protein
VVFNPLSLFGPVRWGVDTFRKYRQWRRKVTVLVHGPGFFPYGGSSPLTESSNVSVPTTGTPITGTGRAPMVSESGDANLIGLPLYWFMKVANKSLTRDVVLTHARFEGAPRDELNTRERLSIRLKPDQEWEGWLSVARLPNAKNIEQSGRVRISGKEKPIKSRLNKHVPPTGRIAGC